MISRPPKQCARQYSNDFRRRAAVAQTESDDLKVTVEGWARIAVFWLRRSGRVEASATHLS